MEDLLATFPIPLPHVDLTIVLHRQSRCHPPYLMVGPYLVLGPLVWPPIGTVGVSDQ